MNDPEVFMNLDQIWHESIHNCKKSISDCMKQTALDVIELQASIRIIGADLCFICNNDFIEKLIVEYVPSIYLEITSLIGNNRLGIKILLSDEFQFLLQSASYEDRFFRENIRPDKTFDNYISDPRNNQLFELALKIAQNPGAKGYNPFFVYGQSGIGKTHLVLAIANRIKLTRPELTVRYTRGEEFIRLFVEYMTKSEFQDTTLSIESYTSHNDVLIIDDIQAISKDKKSLGTFIEIIAPYIELPKKQLIVTSTDFPRTLLKLASKRSSVLFSGVCGEMVPPSVGMLLSITRSKCEELDIQLDREVVEYIANNVSSNVRYIEGAIKTLKQHVENNHNHITRDEAVYLLSDIVNCSKQPI